MAEFVALPDTARKALEREIDRKGLRGAAVSLGVDRATLTRAAGGAAVSRRTLAALSRIAPRVRDAAEFRGVGMVSAPPAKVGPYVWDLEAIRVARDQQIRGVFDLPVRLAEAMRTDDALFTAYHARIAPQQSIEARLVAAPGPRGALACRKAAVSVFTPRSVLSGLHGTLANHGLAIGQVIREPNEAGTLVDMRLVEWPLEYVRWQPYDRTLVTMTAEGATVPIVHGDGQWIIFRKFMDRPWTQEACVLPAALLWAAHANAVRDWAASSKAHGLSKIVGELPEGVALMADDGTLSPEAAAFLTLLQDLVSGEGGAGIRPAGGKTDFLSDGSTAWQVFSELVNSREKSAARIYLGTDAILGSVGGAPGVDISTLFGVMTTKLQSDLAALEQGIRTGLLEPWSATNLGTSQHAPSLVYQLPDPDAEQKAAQRAARRGLLLDAIDRYRAAGLEISQTVIDALATDLGVTDAPRLPPLASASVTLTLAPTDVAKVVRVREARASQGLPPFGDDRDDLTLGELDARNAAPPAPPAPPAVPT